MAYCKDNLLYDNRMTYYIRGAVNSKPYRFFHDMNIVNLTLKLEMNKKSSKNTLVNVLKFAMTF